MKEELFDRKELEQAIKDGKTIVITGPQRTGKTTLYKEFLFI